MNNPYPYSLDNKRYQTLNYYFKTPEEFWEMIQADAFLEHAEYVGNYYGTPAAPVDESIAAGNTVILDIEVQGAMQIRALRPDAKFIFIAPPSFETLRHR